MIEKDLNKVLNYMKQYVENKYEHDSEPMLNWKDLKLVLDEIERLNNIINELEKSKEKQINEYEILILKIEKYLNCYQYFLETQEENNKKIANMIHEFSLGSDKE